MGTVTEDARHLLREQGACGGRSECVLPRPPALLPRPAMQSRDSPSRRPLPVQQARPRHPWPSPHSCCPLLRAPGIKAPRKEGSPGVPNSSRAWGQQPCHLERADGQLRVPRVSVVKIAAMDLARLPCGRERQLIYSPLWPFRDVPSARGWPLAGRNCSVGRLWLAEACTDPRELSYRRGHLGRFGFCCISWETRHLLPWGLQPPRGSSANHEPVCLTAPAFVASSHRPRF